MGGCATKPKVLKGDEGDVLSPSPRKETAPEAKEAATDQGENKVEADDKSAENKDVNDDNIDDQSNNKRSLSNLFKEKENKGTAKSDNTQSEAEPMKKETLESFPHQSLDTVKQELEPVAKNQENKEPEKPVEPVSVPPVNVKPAKPNEAKPTLEAAPTAAIVDVPETQCRETSGETIDKNV